jgi:hypothetical protein
MSTYEELSESIRKHAVEVADRHNSCFHFGELLMKKLSAYWECPVDGVWYRELNKNLAWGDRKWQV